MRTSSARSTATSRAAVSVDHRAAPDAVLVARLSSGSGGRGRGRCSCCRSSSSRGTARAAILPALALISPPRSTRTAPTIRCRTPCTRPCSCQFPRRQVQGQGGDRQAWSCAPGRPCFSAALVFAGVQVHLSVLGYSVANIAAGLLWIWVAVHLRRRQLALVTATSGAAAGARRADGTSTPARRRRAMNLAPPASRPPRRPRAAGRASSAGRRPGPALVPGPAGRLERARRRRRARGRPLPATCRSSNRTLLLRDSLANEVDRVLVHGRGGARRRTSTRSTRSRARPGSAHATTFER